VFVLFILFHSFHLDRLLYSGQLLDVYPLHSLMLTGLLLLFYLLFYLVARELDINTRLKQENQFLHMQTAHMRPCAPPSTRPAGPGTTCGTTSPPSPPWRTGGPGRICGAISRRPPPTFPPTS